jgi:hypothetical protein
MGVIVAAFLVLGALCGATIRLIPFVIVLIGAAAIAGMSSGRHGLGVVLDIVIALIALQAGYFLGIAARAAARAWRQGRAKPARGAGKPSTGLQTEHKHR